MKFFTVASVLALPLLAVARATPSPPSGSVEQCNTGSIQCCNSFQSVSNDGIAGILGLLGVVTQGETTLFGINCSPIDILGVGGNSCTSQPVCCQNNSFNGLVVIGCTPINVGL